MRSQKINMTGKMKMKKIICFAIIFAVLFTFSAETAAMKDLKLTARLDEYRIPIKVLEKNSLSEKSFSIKKTDSTLKTKTESLPDFYPTANLTVVDSNQVKVKYDFWIIKVFKDIFKIN